MALCWQLFFAGPLVRFLFRQGMKCAVKLRKTHNVKSGGSSPAYRRRNFLRLLFLCN